jgi:hypothetical protein
MSTPGTAAISATVLDAGGGFDLQATIPSLFQLPA